jgi:hypothetical protein
MKVLLPAHMNSAPRNIAIALIKNAEMLVFSILIAVTFIPKIEDAKLTGRKIKASMVTICCVSNLSFGKSLQEDTYKRVPVLFP